MRNYIYFLLLVTTVLLAREKKTNVAILQLKAIGVKVETAMILTDKLSSVLNSTGKYNILERERIISIIQEQGLQNSGTCSTNDCLVEIGGLLGANKMVTGSIGYIDSLYIISLRLFDVETAATDKIVDKEAICSARELPKLIQICGLKLADIEIPENVSEEKSNLITNHRQTNQQSIDKGQIDKAKLSYKNMVLVEAGTFQMGTSDNYTDLHLDTEHPQHSVMLNSFYLGKYEVTQAEWQEIMGSNPSNFKGNLQLPVERICWYDALIFCNKLSLAEGLTPCYSQYGRTNPSSWNDDLNSVKCNWEADGYRLPTEAEWEFASSGGNKTKNYKYSGSNQLGEVAWYYSNANNQTQVVGLKRPNELGLHDMSGNVSEWNWDWAGLYDSDEQSNPCGVSSSTSKICRGSNYFYGADKEFWCRVKTRISYYSTDKTSYIGLRLARSL